MAAVYGTESAISALTVIPRVDRCKELSVLPHQVGQSAHQLASFGCRKKLPFTTQGGFGGLDMLVSCIDRIFLSELTLHGAVDILGTGRVNGSDWFIGAVFCQFESIDALDVLIDIRGVDGGDGLSRGSRDKFVVDEKTSGLRVAVPVGRDDIHREGHIQLCQRRNGSVELSSCQILLLSIAIARQDIWRGQSSSSA